MSFRGKDRLPYGAPNNNRQPGRGRQSKYPWRTWMSEPKTWEVDCAAYGVDAYYFKRMISVKVAQANKKMLGQGVQGWITHKCQVIPLTPEENPSGLPIDPGTGIANSPTRVDLTFWWIPGPGATPEDVVPPEIQDHVALRQNMTPADRATELATLEVPAFAPHQQEAAKLVMCPETWASPTQNGMHTRGYYPTMCRTCALDLAEGRAYTPDGPPA